MIKVGITGGIGSGKTTFCKEWEKLGAFVLYADDFAKQLMTENEELKLKIREVFGEKSYTEKGELNRSYLAEEAFAKGRVSELNEIVHPVLWKETDKLADQKEKKGVPVFAKEAAILLNNGRPEDIDYVILLLADKDLRVKRTSERDGAAEKAIIDRMTKQPDFESLTHLADYIVENNGTVEELKTKARVIYKELKGLALNN
ncbi:dephospho-CoA kinase [Gracilimonas amylolytica]|uniref:dephospho-CoA kinase n=1 Tax=Gracilimonas amylolytica TaxID=1749045 RepID=UPI000CD7FE91|nr:dephospho-CoA kinase [Gracilimonas amylolytica]